MAGEKPFIQAIGWTKATGMYEVVLPLFLIWALLYAVLANTKVLSEANDLNALVAFVVALMVVLVPKAREYITLLVPYVTVYILILFSIVLAYLAAGASVEDLSKSITDRRAYLVLFGILLLLFILPLTQIFGEELSPSAVSENVTAGGNGGGEKTTAEKVSAMEMQERVVYLLSSPPVVGMMVLVAVFGISTYTLVGE